MQLTYPIPFVDALERMRENHHFITLPGRTASTEEELRQAYVALGWPMNAARVLPPDCTATQTARPQNPALAEANRLRQEAKSLGIVVAPGMKSAEIRELIAAKKQGD